MIDVSTNFGLKFKPPSMHELRTWILKEDVNDVSVMMEAIWILNYVRWLDGWK